MGKHDKPNSTNKGKGTVKGAAAKPPAHAKPKSEDQGGTKK